MPDSLDLTDRAIDADLVRQLVAGSQTALGELYDRHASAVYAAAVRGGGDSWIAADIVQETFLALWNHAERFDPERGGLRAWLLTIARNRVVDHHRAARRHDRAVSFSSFGHEDDRSFAEWVASAGELVGSATAEPGPEATVASHEVGEAIVTAVATLPPDERKAILLAYGQGLSQSEIAAALAWPIGTVKTRTRRALQHLRETLARLENGRRGELPASAGWKAPAGGPPRLFPGCGNVPTPCLSADC